MNTYIDGINDTSTYSRQWLKDITDDLLTQQSPWHEVGALFLNGTCPINAYEILL